MCPKIEILIHFFSEDIILTYKKNSKVGVFCKNTFLPLPSDITQADLSKEKEMRVFVATVSKLYNKKLKVYTNWTNT